MWSEMAAWFPGGLQLVTVGDREHVQGCNPLSPWHTGTCCPGLQRLHPLLPSFQPGRDGQIINGRGLPPR